MKLVLNTCFISSLIYVALSSQIATKVIGGTDSFVGQFPFAVAVYVTTNDSRFFCGGALLDHFWVITAGHCVYNGKEFKIQLGSNTLDSADSNRVTYDSNEYILHPDFNPDTILNDVGLIRLRASVPFTTYLQPINLPSVDLINDNPVTVLGWGQTSDFDFTLSNTLKHVTASVLENTQCRLIYGNAISDTMACVEGNYNEGTCTGDNGSALVEYVSHYYWLVGIASFISGNGCESTDPSGYTRTFPYTNWIKNVTY